MPTNENRRHSRFFAETGHPSTEYSNNLARLWRNADAVFKQAHFLLCNKLSPYDNPGKIKDFYNRLARKYNAIRRHIGRESSQDLYGIEQQFSQIVSELSAVVSRLQLLPTPKYAEQIPNAPRRSKATNRPLLVSSLIAEALYVASCMTPQAAPNSHEALMEETSDAAEVEVPTPSKTKAPATKTAKPPIPTETPLSQREKSLRAKAQEANAYVQAMLAQNPNMIKESDAHLQFLIDEGYIDKSIITADFNSYGYLAVAFQDEPNYGDDGYIFPEFLDQDKKPLIASTEGALNYLQNSKIKIQDVDGKVIDSAKLTATDLKIVVGDEYVAYAVYLPTGAKVAAISLDTRGWGPIVPRRSAESTNLTPTAVPSPTAVNNETTINPPTMESKVEIIAQLVKEAEQSNVLPQGLNPEQESDFNQLAIENKLSDTLRFVPPTIILDVESRLAGYTLAGERLRDRAGNLVTDVRVEPSADGETWTLVRAPYQFTFEGETFSLPYPSRYQADDLTLTPEGDLALSAHLWREGDWQRKKVLDPEGKETEFPKYSTDEAEVMILKETTKVTEPNWEDENSATRALSKARADKMMGVTPGVPKIIYKEIKYNTGGGIHANGIFIVDDFGVPVRDKNGKVVEKPAVFYASNNLPQTGQSIVVLEINGESTKIIIDSPVTTYKEAVSKGVTSFVMTQEEYDAIMSALTPAN